MLKQTAVYQRLKSSFVRDLYMQTTNRHWLELRRDEVEFYRGVLAGMRSGDLIFDIGANDGTKTDVFLRLGAKVIAIDPDDLNQQLIRSKFLRYRLAPKPVVVVGKAVSDTCSSKTMWIDGPGSALNTLSDKWAETLKEKKESFEGGNFGLDFAQSKTIETTTIEELIRLYGMPYFIKIDVEGYEIHVIRGLKQPVPFVSYEVNLPEFREEGIECVRILNSLSPAGRFNYVVDCQKGLALSDWLSAADFVQVFDRCTEDSVEVFWKSGRAN
ncbi:MAG: FkbM family methyltransferase [Acidobacteria bacterium]|nr:FkbM family methyltransferase [Acidobacteriota bacterium]